MRKRYGVPYTFVSTEEDDEENVEGGAIGTGTARAVHAQPPGRAHPVCIRALPIPQEEPAKSRLTRHCATCLATVVINIRYIAIVIYVCLRDCRFLFKETRHREMTKRTIHDGDRSDVKLTAKFETGPVLDVFLETRAR